VIIFLVLLVLEATKGNMMNELASHKVHCPYCGEIIELLIDCSVEQQNYLEDCEVCCCPIVVDVSIDNQGQRLVNVRNENQ
jgi:hypothetical protein